VTVLPVADTPPQRRIFATYRAGGLRSPTTGAMVEILHEVSQRLEEQSLRHGVGHPDAAGASS
jgi:hypothetical protein